MTWREDQIGGPICDDGTDAGRRLALNYRSNVTRFALHDFGEECSTVEFDWPGMLLEISGAHFPIGAMFVAPRTGQQGVVLSSRPQRMRVALS